MTSSKRKLLSGTILDGRTGRGLSAAGLITSATGFFAAAPAWASGSSMPWEQPLQQILDSIQGRSPRSSR